MPYISYNFDSFRRQSACLVDRRFHVVRNVRFSTVQIPTSEMPISDNQSPPIIFGVYSKLMVFFLAQNAFFVVSWLIIRVDEHPANDD